MTGRVRDSGASGSQASLRVSSRVHGYDVIRGLAVISMVGFHFCYDLATLKGASIPWFRPPFQDVWRASISWTFLIVAGVMCSYSRSNLRRGVRYLVLALVIFAVTIIAAVDTPISFGIIYCMGASTLCAWALDSVGAFPRGPRGLALSALVFAMLFVLCLGVPSGTIGFAPFGGPFLRLTRVPYDSGFLSWLGFPGPHFSSGDYYPPLPFSLLYLSGVSLGRLFRSIGTPRWLRRLSCRPIEWVGRHALPVYVLHQPILLAITLLIEASGARW